MSILSNLGESAKYIAVLFVRLYILVVGAWGVYGLLTGTWLAALGLVFPVAYFAYVAWRSYQQSAEQPQKQVAS